MQWNPVEDKTVEAYRLYKYLRGQKPTVVAEVKTGSELFYLDNNVSEGQLCFYFVRSVNANGELGKQSEETGIRID